GGAKSIGPRTYSSGSRPRQTAADLGRARANAWNDLFSQRPHTTRGEGRTVPNPALALRGTVGLSIAYFVTSRDAFAAADECTKPVRHESQGPNGGDPRACAERVPPR